MNLFQQLSESKLSKEEIEALIEICNRAVEMYYSNLEQLDKVIKMYKASDAEGEIKMVFETDDGIETRSKSLEDVELYRQQVIDENENEIEYLKTAHEKLTQLAKIFE